MRNLAYACPECEIIFIAERSSEEEYRSAPIQLELSNEEIADIRSALQKLTRRRILNTSDAEDIVQDTLLTMIVRNPGSELKKGLLVWSQGILRNKVGNYYRKSRRHESFSKRDAGYQQQLPFPVQTAPQETALSGKELQSIISEKLAEFPPAIRGVMELLVTGLETGEIVERLSPEPYQNVINRLYRGRKRLARELIKCGFTPRSGKKADVRKIPARKSGDGNAG